MWCSKILWSKFRKFRTSRQNSMDVFPMRVFSRMQGAEFAVIDGLFRLPRFSSFRVLQSWQIATFFVVHEVGISRKIVIRHQLWILRCSDALSEDPKMRFGIWEFVAGSRCESWSGSDFDWARLSPTLPSNFLAANWGFWNRRIGAKRASFPVLFPRWKFHKWGWEFEQFSVSGKFPNPF